MPGHLQLVTLLAERNNEAVADTVYRLFFSALEHQLGVLADFTCIPTWISGAAKKELCYLNQCVFIIQNID
jgi:hypothetical protein